MATDYDAPRKTDDEPASVEALRTRIPDRRSGALDVDDAADFELPGTDILDAEFDVVVLPPQADEFTCVACFLVKHHSQIDHQGRLGPICLDCAA